MTAGRAQDSSAIYPYLESQEELDLRCFACTVLIDAIEVYDYVTRLIGKWNSSNPMAGNHEKKF